ncbi:hypothetical protein E2C01_052125 [Portunus trituberculatus]|uniref:Secreted protein n=1 Tax=Portunus trituberculatus TaxID=210409 RepID=A0A5B7GCT3_PORTR|nr:hypothetical protein [Portunus trituberculatus]
MAVASILSLHLVVLSVPCDRLGKPCGQANAFLPQVVRGCETAGPRNSLGIDPLLLMRSGFSAQHLELCPSMP